MSINKSFVVKNGLEVNTDLIFADANLNKVGIASTAPRTELDVRGGIAATDLYLAGVATIATLKVTTGIVTDLLATNITAGVVTSLSIQTTDINVSGFATAQDLQVDGTATIAVGVVTYLSGTNLNYSGIGTVENLNATNLNVTGFSTFDSYADFNGGVIIDNLNVTGVATISAIGVSGAVFDRLVVNNFGTLNGVTTIANADVTNLDVTGISTLGTVQVSSGIITATSGIVTYYGDGAYLQNISAGIGIGTTGGLVGYAATFINFYGTGVSTAQYDNTTGIATIFFEGGGSGTIGIGTEFPPFNNSNGDLFYNAEYARIFVYYDENVIGVGTDAYWVDAAPFNVGIITSLSNVAFAPGSANSPSMYFLGDTQTGFFSPTTGETTFVSAGSSILNINASGIDVTGIVTATRARIGAATTFTEDLVVEGDARVTGILTIGTGTLTIDSVGNINTTGIITASHLNVNGNVSIAGTLTYEDVTNVDSIGLITARTGIQVLAGGINAVGVITATSFSGDGSGLTGVASTDNIITSTPAQFLDTVVVGSAVTINSTGVYTIAGIVTAFDFDTLSDINYKENVETVNNALDIVSDLRGVKFDWKETKQPSYGVIAQELEEVLPELVRGDNPKVVNYNGIIGVLIEAIKELKQEIKDLKSS